MCRPGFAGLTAANTAHWCSRRPDCTVWDWKTTAVANTPAYFNVHFGADDRVVRTSTHFVNTP